jgi:RimJ/RimL family protein N-acetyltransferase
VEKMDGRLLDRSGLSVPQNVRDTLETWRDLGRAEFQDYGFVIIHGNEVVAWATVDFIAGGRGDIGFFTQEPYRRQGLATVTAAAALEHGLAPETSPALIKAHWTCAEDNRGSIRLAEKLGCRLDREYWIHFLAFDESSHRIQLAYSRLQAGQYQNAIEEYKQFVASREAVPVWVHLDLARARAGLGHAAEAFEHLHTALNLGWKNLEEARNWKEFASLLDRPEWAGFRSGHFAEPTAPAGHAGS